MSTLERIRNRQNRALVLTVCYPRENPELELTVKKLPEAFLDNAQFEAEGVLRKRGIFSNSEEWNKEYWVIVAYTFAEQIKKHITGWKALDGGQLPQFSPFELDYWFSRLKYIERVELSNAYRAAEDADEKKSMPETSSGGASEKPSANDSSSS